MSSLQLRPYQEASIQNLRQGFINGHKRQVLAAATGSGKSVVALSMLQAAREKGSRVMFVCDRRVLVDQFSRHLERSHIEHGVLMSSHWRYRPYEKVQVASIQTLERQDEWPKVDLIIVDEIHAVMRKSLKDYIKANPETKIVGLTATPFHPELGNYFTDIVNVVTMKKLVDENYLVPFRVFCATEIDTTGVTVTAGEWQKDELEQRGLVVVGDVVADYISISQRVFGGYKKTICFSSGVNHGHALAKQFAEHGLKFVPISYKDTEEYKQEVLEEFAKPDTDINGVISSDILTRGFDQTDVEHVIVAKPLRKSFSMHVQIVGRGARTHDGKKFCVIQDNSGNWLRFLEDWETLYGNGVESLKADADTKTRKEPTEKEKKESKCPRCSFHWGNMDVCPSCGCVRERKSKVVSVPGEISEISSGVSMENKQTFWSELQFQKKYRGWSDKRCLATYRERFGVWPRGLNDTVVTPSPQTEAYIHKRTQAYIRKMKRG